MTRNVLSITLVLLFVLQFALLLLLALGQYWQFPQVLPTAWATDALARVLAADSGLLSGLGLSPGLSTTVAVIATGLGFVIARAIAKTARPNRWITLSYLPYALPPVLLAVLVQPAIISRRLSGSLGATSFSRNITA